MNFLMVLYQKIGHHLTAKVEKYALVQICIRADKQKQRFVMGTDTRGQIEAMLAACFREDYVTAFFFAESGICSLPTSVVYWYLVVANSLVPRSGPT